METVKLANILLEENRQFHETPLLYVRTSSFITPADEDDAWRISPGKADFTTFFNALSVAKWREYTAAHDFFLHLEHRGGTFAYVQTHAQRIDIEPQRLESTKLEIAASGDWQELEIPLSVADKDILVGFVLEAHGSFELRNSYYYTLVDAHEIRPVELAIATTTFRKEEFIERNIELVRTRILGSAERAAGHLTMHVVDNGRTLDAEALTGGGVVVHPNPNAGGAGGFARGMMEALEQELPATHVLLMDDDVEVSPESLLRTFNLLALARDEWADAFVSGAMMSWDRPDLLWEDGGFMRSSGVCGIVKSNQYGYMNERDFQRMSSLRGIVANETYRPNVRSFPDLTQRYSAWWYCCIPAETIRREGLPLPLFVRYDDVEYGLRCKPKFMTMNGICIWHMDFSLRYNAAVEHYQTTRNGLVINAVTNAAPLSDFAAQVVERARIELTKFNYTDAELILDGFEDFLKGPGFISAPGKAEETYLAANKRREQLVPLAELRERVLAETGVDVYDLDSHDLTEDYPLGLTLHGTTFRVSRMQTFLHTLNGQLAGKLKQYAGPVAFINANMEWPVGKIYGVDTIVAIDAPSKRGTIRRRDNKRCQLIWNRLQSDLKEYHRTRDEIEEVYRESRNLITSTAYWKRYLGLE